jgi:hypothetical protein
MIAASLVKTASPPNIASPVARLDRERSAANHAKHPLEARASQHKCGDELCAHEGVIQ